MENLKPPHPLSFEGSLSNNFVKWKKQYLIYSTAAGVTSKSEEVQVAVLLHCLGPEAQERLDTLGLTVKENGDWKLILQKLEDNCLPKSNESVDRHIFFSRNQHVGESFDEFLLELKKLSSSCNFGSLKDSLIKDRVISGINNVNLKERLLKEENLNLEKAVKICKLFELSAQQLNTLQNSTTVEGVNVVKKTSQQQQPAQNRTYSKSTYGQGNQPNHPSKDQRRIINCTRCGLDHTVRNCPAYGKTCYKCNKLNHFGKCCKVGFQSNTVRLVNHEDDNVKNTKINDNGNVRLVTNENDKFLGVVSNRGINHNRWHIDFSVNDSQLSAKLDTGADVNVIPLCVFQSLNLPVKLVASTSSLTNFNGSAIHVVGKCNLDCHIPNVGKCNIEFEVANCNKNTPIVLGWVTIDKYNLHKQVGLVQNISNEKCNEVVSEYIDVFSSEYNTINNFEYKIQLKPGAVGKIEGPRKVPFVYMDQLKQELDQIGKWKCS
ncbi:uncharacterized protein LOC111050145 isoform X1 [Nilaparvata lugens]|uniref:uncharacterized protein LOC111050145 isoform X1 n=1 Tax=Nilaparvata lugens TaxID=108931 RepID=UPI00193D9415|nr:uncharacterized protein LOC111050145 isoform X1 [Nilaparvata lugens]